MLALLSALACVAPLDESGVGVAHLGDRSTVVSPRSNPRQTTTRGTRRAPAGSSAPPGRPDPELDPLARAQRAMVARRGRSSTRERLLDAAMELFHERGYHATGIAAILQRADVLCGSLYHFFPTKEDLLLALLDRYKQMLGPMVIEPVFARVSDPIERVFGVLEGYRQMLIATDCSRGCPIGNLALELSDDYPNVRMKIAENFDGWRRAVQSCLEAAKDRLPPDTDVEQLSIFVLTVMEGGMMQAKATRSLEPFEASVAQLREYFELLIAQGTDWSPARSRRAPPKRK